MKVKIHNLYKFIHILENTLSKQIQDIYSVIRYETAHGLRIYDYYFYYI
jgi:hypothetical protein